MNDTDYHDQPAVQQKQALEGTESDKVPSLGYIDVRTDQAGQSSKTWMHAH